MILCPMRMTFLQNRNIDLPAQGSSENSAGHTVGSRSLLEWWMNSSRTWLEHSRYSWWSSFPGRWHLPAVVISWEPSGNTLRQVRQALPSSHWRGTGWKALGHTHIAVSRQAMEPPVYSLILYNCSLPRQAGILWPESSGPNMCERVPRAGAIQHCSLGAKEGVELQQKLQ